MKTFKSPIVGFIYLVCLFSVLFSPASLAKSKFFSIMHYNVENLFDTTHDEGKDDQDFTPGGSYKWTKDKLQAKLEILTRVVRTVNAGEGPAVITLAEVENIDVLKQWCATEMRDLGYKPILIEGPDGRGIDVAMLTKFPLIGKPISLNVSDPKKGRPTRDVLIVTLDLEGVPLTVMVNHWPSRLGGIHAQEYRIAVAKKTYQAIEQIIQRDPDMDILVAGDFNDDPEDASFIEGLRVTWKFEDLLKPDTLFFYPASYESFNLPAMMKAYRKKYQGTPGYKPKAYENKIRKARGTYYYSGDKIWNAFDELVMNRNLFDNKRVTYYSQSYRIIREPFMLTKNGYPKFTKAGGPSDHFPVSARFVAHLSDDK